MMQRRGTKEEHNDYNELRRQNLNVREIEEVEIVEWVEYWRGGRYKEKAAAVCKVLLCLLLNSNSKLHTFSEPPGG